MSPRTRLAAALLAPAALALAPGRAVAASPGPEAGARSSCERCHVDLGGELGRPAEAFARDVHAQPHLGCAGCHGGDPTSDDPAVAMDPARGFRGTPARRRIPELCGSCHSDAAFVKRWAPNLPTDQLAQYRTSVHAARLAKGDRKAAVCTSCHGAHGIVSPRDPRSPVYPSHVVDTCARCHAGEGPSSPVAAWRRSVHAEALAAGDLSAPTCPRCHGAHGATPPGVHSVANVCGQCHPQNMALFRASPHRAVFEAKGHAACEACHRNHDVLRPSDAWVGVTAGSVCGECHSASDGGGMAAAAMHDALGGAAGLLRRAEQRTEAARSRGMLMTEAQVALEEASQQLIHARTLVHGADAAQLEAKAQAANAASRKAIGAADRAFAELRYRRAGLLVALGVIVLAVVALALKIRQIDAARGRR